MKSVIPKELLEKGLMADCDILMSKADLKWQIEHFASGELNEFHVDYAKKQLKDFKAEYFSAEDVEACFRELFERLKKNER